MPDEEVPKMIAEPQANQEPGRHSTKISPIRRKLAQLSLAGITAVGLAQGHATPTHAQEPGSTQPEHTLAMSADDLAALQGGSETSEKTDDPLIQHVSKLKQEGIFGYDTFMKAIKGEPGSNMLIAPDLALTASKSWEGLIAYQVQSGDTYWTIMRPFMEAKVDDYMSMMGTDTALREKLVHNALILGGRLEELNQINDFSNRKGGVADLRTGDVMSVGMAVDGVTDANLDVLVTMINGDRSNLNEYGRAIVDVMATDPSKLDSAQDKTKYQAVLGQAGYRLSEYRLMASYLDWDMPEPASAADPAKKVDHQGAKPWDASRVQAARDISRKPIRK